MPTVQSVSRGTGNVAGTLGADRLVRSLADRIFLMEAAYMPLTAFARQMGKITVPAIKHEWFEDEIFPEALHVDGAVASTVTTAVTFDSPHGNYVDVGDVLYSKNTEEQFLVDAVTSATVLELRRGFGGTAVNIGDDDTLLRIGNAMSQGSNVPGYKQTLEVLRTNQIQRFRKSFSVSAELFNSKVYAEKVLPYQKRKTLLELLREIEYSNFFSQVQVGDGLVEVTTATSRDPNIMAGIKEYIDDNSDANLSVDHAGSALTEAELNTFMRNLFSSKEGHDPLTATKVLFASPAAIEDIEAMVSPDVRITPTTTKHNVKVKEWQTTFGDVMIVNHPMLKDPDPVTSGVDNMMFAIDLKYIQQVVQTGMDLEYSEIDKSKTTGQEVIEGEWKMSQCLEVKGTGAGAVGGVHGYAFGIND